ncbi:hypothetical protein GCM10023329_25520 [Streptomyces sanyensis]|uniref:Uncharacterized protein n=1 Tax=Streptomyces sanyensis TaxID=568869 RepID=A0ABP9AA23_9ACTN
MASEVEAQGSYTSFRQSSREPREEATLFAGDASAVYEHHGLGSWLPRLNQGAGEVETVEGTDTHVCGWHGGKGRPVGSAADRGRLLLRER